MRKVLTVLTVQALVLTAAALLVAGSLAIGGEAGALFPESFRVQLTPSRADASPASAAEALRRAFPHADVQLREDQIVITFAQGARDVARARATLEREGFEAGRFTIGRDFAPVGIAGRLLTAFSSFAVMIVSFPLMLLAAAVLLRRRLPASARRSPQKPLTLIVVSGIAGGAALALGSELLGRLVKALGYPIVEQPWIETIARLGGAAPLAMLVLVAVLFAPVGEEMFYRGWVFRYLEDAGVPLAYGVSTLLFAAIHFHPPALPAYVLLGLGLAALYRWSGSIWTPILAHATNNVIAIAALIPAFR